MLLFQLLKVSKNLLLKQLKLLETELFNSVECLKMLPTQLSTSVKKYSVLFSTALPSAN